MPSPEKETDVPEIDPESRADLAWLEQYLTIFWLAADFGYEQEGRGAIVVDVSTQAPDADHGFSYYRQELIAQDSEVSKAAGQLVETYDPSRELVTVLRKPDRARGYLLKVGDYWIGAMETAARRDAIQLDDVNDPIEQKATLEPPDLETLMVWADEGGCEAACPHACWVEPDGACSHGHPSWLLKLGLI